jgi:hypothetical protein
MVVAAAVPGNFLAANVSAITIMPDYSGHVYRKKLYDFDAVHSVQTGGADIGLN